MVHSRVLEGLKDMSLLDPMYIFKNVGHSLGNHLVCLKNTLVSRASLEYFHSKPHLWPRDNTW